MSLLHTLLGAAAAVVLVAVAGCSTNDASRTPADYQPELFDADTYTSRYRSPPAQACEAARRALLSQGYAITQAKADRVQALKYFQPHPERHVELEFQVVCAPEDNTGNSSVVFASGRMDQFAMRRVKNSASLGVGGLGSVSLPVGAAMDSMVKISSQTLTSKNTYDRFFSLLNKHLNGTAVVPDRESGADTP